MDPALPTAPIDELVERLSSEGFLGMSAAARRLGTFRDGKATHAATPTRWHLHGVTTPGGEHIRLEAVRLNGRLVTSWPAVLRFITRQQPTDMPPAAVVRSPAARDRASARAGRELDDLIG